MPTLQPTVVTALTTGAVLLMLASGIQKRRLVW